jgi:hypothetical protein
MLQATVREMEQLPNVIAASQNTICFYWRIVRSLQQSHNQHQYSDSFMLLLSLLLSLLVVDVHAEQASYSLRTHGVLQYELQISWMKRGILTSICGSM